MTPNSEMISIVMINKSKLFDYL